METDTLTTLQGLEVAFGALALLLALALRPWRMLQGSLLTPALASLVMLPWLWLLPQHLPQGLQVQFSGASLLVLMLGWPVAVPVLTAVAAVVWFQGQAGLEQALSQWVWLGLMPATVAMAAGAGLRRWLPANLFVYTLGRGFFGTMLSVFVPGVVYEWLHHLQTGVSLHEALIARWLMAWGDAFLTGLIVAVFVAFVPQWLATWSDERYLKPPSV